MDQQKNLTSVQPHTYTPRVIIFSVAHNFGAHNVKGDYYCLNISFNKDNNIQNAPNRKCSYLKIVKSKKKTFVLRLLYKKNVVKTKQQKNILWPSRAH